jgi:hypothetical protein
MTDLGLIFPTEDPSNATIQQRVGSVSQFVAGIFCSAAARSGG